MKKVFDSFYVFSKFSLSFILLLCVFFLIYLLYTNYQNEDEVSKLHIELENELRENIKCSIIFLSFMRQMDVSSHDVSAEKTSIFFWYIILHC